MELQHARIHKIGPGRWESDGRVIQVQYRSGRFVARIGCQEPVIMSANAILVAADQLYGSSQPYEPKDFRKFRGAQLPNAGTITKARVRRKKRKAESQ